MTVRVASAAGFPAASASPPPARWPCWM